MKGLLGITILVGMASTCIADSTRRQRESDISEILQSTKRDKVTFQSLVTNHHLLLSKYNLSRLKKLEDARKLGKPVRSIDELYDRVQKGEIKSADLSPELLKLITEHPLSREEQKTN